MSPDDMNKRDGIFQEPINRRGILQDAQHANDAGAGPYNEYASARYRYPDSEIALSAAISPPRRFAEGGEQIEGE
jgi:hypothetical protein